MKLTAINKERIQEHVKNSIHDNDLNQFDTLKQACKHLYAEFYYYYNTYRVTQQPIPKKAFSDFLTMKPLFFETDYANIIEFLQSVDIPSDSLSFDEAISTYHSIVYDVTTSNLR